MLRSCYRPLERCLSRRNADGLLWHTDLKPHASGDFSIAVVQANSSLEDQSQVYTSPSATYVGVYDGHGGPEASRFVNRRLFPYLHQFSKEHGGLSEDVIKKAFSATEEEFVHLVKRSFPVKPQIASVGSCCLVGAIADDVLYVANLGDSRAVLGRRVPDGQKSRVVAERLSTDHNVGSEEVRKEVEALHPDDSTVVVFCRGVWRIKGIIQESHDLSLGPMVPCSCEVKVAYYRERDVHGDLIQHNPTIPLVLCVSRSIGDVYLKKPEFNRDPIYQQFGISVPMRRPVLSAEPSIIIRKLKSDDLFVIFASDGLWEHLTDQEATEIVTRSPRAGIAKTLVGAAIQSAARKREMRYKDIQKIEKGTRRHFHDDITVVVIFLDQRKELGSGRSKHNAVSCTKAPVDIYSNDEDKLEELYQTASLKKRTQVGCH